MEDRSQRVKTLEKVYDGRYGEYKFYGYQVFVFKRGNKAYKTLLVREDPAPIHIDRKYLKFNTRPVYTGDSRKELKTSKKDFFNEYKWFKETFKNIPHLKIPKEKYSLCTDPMMTGDGTVLIKTEWIKNIQEDMFRMDANKLHKYIIDNKEFRKSITELSKKFIELAEEDIYPDYLGIDNVAIYLDSNNNPRIAMIDPHIVWEGKYCSEDVKRRLDTIQNRLKKFLEDPENIENVKYLTSHGSIEPKDQ